ncbi:2'-5' RNA ligase family protein [Paenibacillus albus]|uniref:2'-5' RNA ligase family protein n=1 Tax=Paenibacillus albus TaxID=2495582 RepID=UPI001D1325D8|nr:2'-5' RNA ligase family protein [Paenibacillus albus]
MFKSFQITLSEPATFGTAVSFISVESKEIYNLHKCLVDSVSPSPDLIKQYFEMDRYHPHLTLGQTHWGMVEAEIEEMNIVARSALSLFPTFEVNEVRVYREVEPNRNEPFEVIRLA